ncbi:MAG: hypothetical protein DA408_20215 [Bacteroidetes bacterium]|nr:MAG: hypothetical protein C7N36_05665 [Bacteroidota bacterium]PTM08617.1 MAG: hypothetical protein DA408_20215 [Bacteroidota bacterium]
MKTFSLFLFLLATSLLIGQNEVVVVHAIGNVTYFATPQSAGQMVYPGFRMALPGSLRCETGARVKLLYNQETFLIEDTKMHPLSELAQLSKGGSNLGFTGRFWSFLTGSMSQSKDEKALEENHEHFMEEVYAGIKGFSHKTYPVKTSQLYTGSLGTEPITFRWSDESAWPVLRFSLINDAGSEVLFALVQKGAFTLDPKQLAMAPGKAYQWQVTAVNGDAPVAQSAPIVFTYDPVGHEKLMADLSAMAEYQAAEPVEQQLMQAYTLEKAGFNYGAAQCYDQASANNPDNVLLRDVHAAFLSRMDLLDAAKKMLQQPAGKE